MKRRSLIGTLLLIVGFTMVTLSSCKSHESCPAYGQKAEAVKAKSI